MEDLTTNTMVDRKGRILLMKNIWKRVCIIGATAAIAVQCMALSGLAAGAPSYTAKYGTPSIDGKVSSSEYGLAQKLNKDNTGIFFGQVDLDDPSLDIHYPELTYQFAWNEQNLYVGVTIAEVESIETSKFQIDLSPENKVKDEQRGVFFTFSILNLDSGLVSVARDNYQTAGSKVTSMNITKKVTAKATKTSSGAQMEIAIPLAELQVSGQGRDFSKITLKEGKWGVATYFIGNGLGFTTSRGKCHYSEVTDNKDSGGLKEYFNPLTFAAKSSGNITTSSQTTKPTSSKNSVVSSSSKPVTTTSNNTANSDKINSVASGNPGTVLSDAEVSGEDIINTESADVSGQESNVDTEESSISESQTDTDGQPKKNSNLGLIIGLIIGGVVIVGAGVVVFLKVKKII